MERTGLRLTAPVPLDADGKPDFRRASETAVPDGPELFLAPMVGPCPSGREIQPGFGLGTVPGGTFDGANCTWGGLTFMLHGEPDTRSFIDAHVGQYPGYRFKRIVDAEFKPADTPYMEGRVIGATEAHIRVLVTHANKEPPVGNSFDVGVLEIYRRPSNTQAAWTPVSSVTLTFTEGILIGDPEPPPPQEVDIAQYYSACHLEGSGDYLFRIVADTETLWFRFTASVAWLGFFI